MRQTSQPISGKYLPILFKFIDFKFQGTLKQLHGTNIEEFVRKYRINCPAALERIKEGRPMTMRGDRVKCVAEIVELFITLLDQINLNIRSVDELFQTLNNLYSALNSMSLTHNDDIKLKVHKW
jgi:ESCRT-I complex subunit VPS28